jgi:hypothetical protein
MFNLYILAQTTVTTSVDTGAMIVPLIVALAFLVVTIVAWWRLFSKAGEPGWASLIPIYNVVVLLRIVGKPAWWILLLLIPFVNFIVLIIVMLDLAKAYGHGAGFGIGLLLLFPIFLLILAFGSSKYVGVPGGSGSVQPQYA